MREVAGMWGWCEGLACRGRRTVKAGMERPKAAEAGRPVEEAVGVGCEEVWVAAVEAEHTVIETRRQRER